MLSHTSDSQFGVESVETFKWVEKLVETVKWMFHSTVKENKHNAHPSQALVCQFNLK